MSRGADFYVDEMRGLEPDSGELDRRIELALARHVNTETPWRVIAVAALLAGLLGAILGIIAVVWFRGGFTLSGEVVGPLTATTLALLHPPGINCSAGQVPFQFHSLPNGLVVSATCATPNDTGAVLSGGCYGPFDDNFLNVEGTTNQVTVAVNSSRVYKFGTPQDINTTSNVRFAQVTVTTGVVYPTPTPDFTAANTQTSFISGLDSLSFTGFWNNSSQLVLAVMVATGIGSGTTIIVCVRIPATAVTFTDTDVITWTSFPASIAPATSFPVPVVLTVSTGFQAGVWTFGSPTTGGTLRPVSGNFTNGAGSIGPYSFCFQS